jgi:hypothetical protein
MSSRLSDPSTMWDAGSPLGALLALERRWLASRRAAFGTGTRVWISPCTPDEETADCIGLALAEDGTIGGAVRARADALPFGDGTVRLLVIQHALDRRLDPAVYGECVRVLATGAELVVFGLNPVSPWRPWLAWHARRNRARPRPRMATRVAALFGQLGLGMQSLSWIGSTRPGHDAAPDASASPRAMLRAAWAICMKKPNDTVIPLRPRGLAAGVELSPGLVPNATPRIRSGA